TSGTHRGSPKLICLQPAAGKNSAATRNAARTNRVRICIVGEKSSLPFTKPELMIMKPVHYEHCRYRHTVVYRVHRDGHPKRPRLFIRNCEKHSHKDNRYDSQRSGVDEREYDRAQRNAARNTESPFPAVVQKSSKEYLFAERRRNARAK